MNFKSKLLLAGLGGVVLFAGTWTQAQDSAAAAVAAPTNLRVLPARLKKKPQSSVQLVDGLRSISASRKKDESLSIEYGYFAGRAELRQRLKLPEDGSPAELTLNGQACNESDGTCHLIRQDIRVATQVASHSRR